MNSELVIPVLIIFFMVGGAIVVCATILRASGHLGGIQQKLGRVKVSHPTASKTETLSTYPKG